MSAEVISVLPRVATRVRAVDAPRLLTPAVRLLLVLPSFGWALLASSIWPDRVVPGCCEEGLVVLQFSAEAGG